MSRLLLLSLVAALPLGAQAPAGGVTVFGALQNGATRAPLAYVTVQLRTDRDSAFVGGRLTDSTGAFTFTGIRKGTYRLEARAVGFEPLSQQVFVGELSAFLDLGPLALVPVTRTLDQVVIAASADEVAATLEKKSYRVADNVSQAGGSVLQAMSNLPGVTVGPDGKVLLRGSDKVAVLIDGKQTALTGAGTQAGLDNLPASAIERIEIINNPSARYDANASAGIVNLVLKQQEQRGLSGKVGLMAGAGALWSRRDNLPTIRPQFEVTPKLNPSFSLNYRTPTNNTFVQGDWLYAPTLNKNEFATRTYDDGTVIYQQVKRNRRTDYATLASGVDHAFDDRNSLAVSALFNREKILDDGDNPYFQGSLANRTRLWQFLEDEVKYTAYATAAATHKFPQPGHLVRVTGIYSFHREDEQYFFTNTLPSFTGKDAFKLLSDEHVTDLNLDYVRPLRQGRLEAGFKGRYRAIPVDMKFFAGLNSPIDTGAGGWATYRETIPALYANYVYESPAIELEGGVRVETVIVDYEVNPDHNTYRSDGYRYTEAFPAIRAAWKFDDAHRLSLFVNRRVDRPNEVDIRIFPKYDEPELIKVGNPGLRPQFTTSVDLGYKTSWATGSFYAAAFHRITDASITRIATQAPGSPLLYNVFQNAGRSSNTGAEVVWQQDVGRRVSLSTNASVYRNAVAAFSVVNRYPVPVTYTTGAQRLISGNFKVNAALRFGPDLDARVSSVYLAPDLLPQGRIGSRYSLDVGVRKGLQRGRGELLVNVTDLLNTMQLHKTIRGVGFSLESRDYLETQVVRVGYSWKY
ncbi:MAG: TonB-dependent receptor [Gemmatimonadetes bacterium]|nr:TonB-dependent receptor [Gemmatimonadota bacterium]